MPAGHVLKQADSNSSWPLTQAVHDEADPVQELQGALQRAQVVLVASYMFAGHDA